MMVLKGVGKGKCLHQLSFTDAPVLRDCYLRSLAASGSLSAFKVVLLVSSPQDRYVPLHSSRINPCEAVRRLVRGGGCSTARGGL